MKSGCPRARVVVAIAALVVAGGASAHRLDDVLQATMLTIGADRIDATIRPVPGQAVASSAIGDIDADGDGAFSPDEQRAFAVRVVDDVAVAIDGRAMQPTASRWTFPPAAAMRDGTGEIVVEWTVAMPAGTGDRAVVVTNRHRRDGVVYLANTLVPNDPDVRVVGERRDARQSRYEVDVRRGFVPAANRASRDVADAPFDPRPWFDLVRLGMRHIGQGADHLLFLTTLLLVAPLRANGGRWAATVGPKRALRHAMGIVTAFTVGHSITLMLTAIGGIDIPARPVEVAIAASIVVSAVRAWRPLFAGREAWVAAGFGLVHGLAFASALDRLGLATGDRVVGTLAFNAGIEAMQLVVVAAVLPALWSFATLGAVRRTAAAIASLAAAGWIVERLFGAGLPIDAVVDAAVRHPVAVSAGLYAIAVVLRARMLISRPASVTDALPA